eukprot:Pgem_evm1s3940
MNFTTLIRLAFLSFMIVYNIDYKVKGLLQEIYTGEIITIRSNETECDPEKILKANRNDCITCDALVIKDYGEY